MATTTKKVSTPSAKRGVRTISQKRARAPVAAPAVRQVKKRISAARPKSVVVKQKSKVVQPLMPLVVAPDEKRFWLHTGETLASLQELADSFAAMDALLFSHHVTKEKNDFARWVEDVLDDVACALSLRRTRTPKSARVVVIRHLQKYSR
jgi:hypothetical protein